jgi:tripartite ATP-independent transporter DctM subunit
VSRFRATLGAIPAFVGIVLVLGSIYSGFATPTEAAGIGGIYAIILALIELRRGAFREFKLALARTASTSCMMMFLVIGSAIFSQVLVIQGVPARVLNAASHVDIGRWGMLVLIMLALAAVGLVINPGPTILITMPIVYPLIQQLGFNGVWFGVMLMIKLELAAITPPIGINLYVTKFVAQARFGEVLRGVMPYWFMMIGTLVVLSFFPQLALWLVSVLPQGR